MPKTYPRAVRDRWEKYPLYRKAYNARIVLQNDAHLRERRAIAKTIPVGPYAITDEKGYFLWGTDHQFDEVAEIVAVAESQVEKGLEWNHNQKSFMNTKVLADYEMTLDSPFMRFALREDLLHSISNYLGMVPILNSIMVWYSQNSGEDLNRSQLYHLDIEDDRQMKIFIACREMTQENGPFTFLDAKSSQQIADAIHLTDKGERGRVPDEDVEKYRGDGKILQFLGAAGSVAAVDTSRCMHFGSRVSEDAPPRLLAMFQFVRPFAFGNFIKAPYAHLATPDMSDMHQLVLNA